SYVNFINGSLISGNTGDGVLFASSSSNEIVSCLIGVNKDGTTALANGGGGGPVPNGSLPNRNEGGDTTAGNTGGGVVVENSTGTTIMKNYIGTTMDGKSAIGNGTTGGVIISTGAVHTTIGGTRPGEGNLISGNDASGVQVQGNAKGTLIE